MTEVALFAWGTTFILGAMIYGRVSAAVAVAKDAREKIVGAVRTIPAPMPVPHMVATLNQKIAELEKENAQLKQEQARMEQARKILFPERPKEQPGVEQTN